MEDPAHVVQCTMNNKMKRDAFSYIAATAAHVLLERWLQDAAGSSGRLPPLPADIRAYIGWIRLSQRIVQGDVRTIPWLVQPREERRSGLMRFVLWIGPDQHSARARALAKLDGPQVNARVLALAAQLQQQLGTFTTMLLERWEKLPAFGDSAGWGDALDQVGEQAAAAAVNSALGDLVLAMKALTRVVRIDPVGIDMWSKLVAVHR